MVIYALCFTRPRYQVSVYRTIGPLVYMQTVANQLPRLGERELIFDYRSLHFVVSVRRGFLYLLVLVIGCVILFRHSLSLPHNHFRKWKVVLSMLPWSPVCNKQVFL